MNRDKLEIGKAPTWFLGGWCLLLCTSILKKMGPYFYDSRFKIAFWEDVGLSWRISLAGYKLGVARWIFLHHFVNTSANKLTSSQLGVAKRNKEVSFKKWED